jgi:hypothetical protein
MSLPKPISLEGMTLGMVTRQLSALTEMVFPPWMGRIPHMRVPQQLDMHVVLFASARNLETFHSLKGRIVDLQGVGEIVEVYRALVRRDRGRQLVTWASTRRNQAALAAVHAQTLGATAHGGITERAAALLAAACQKTRLVRHFLPIQA